VKRFNSEATLTGGVAMRIRDTYIWQPPGHRVAVHLRRSAISQLQSQARAGLIEAVLLGRKGIWHGDPAVVIESTQPRQTDLSSQCARAKRKGQLPVGFARAAGSDGPEPFELSHTDRGLLQSQAAGSSSVFLVVRPPDAAFGNLFFWHDGHAVGEQIRLTPIRAQHKRLLFSIVALAAALLVLVVLLWSSQRPDQPLAPQPLGLIAQREGTNTVLRWNPNAPAMEMAEFASVVIQDGETRRTYQLTKDQIRAGSMAYSPTSPAVRFGVKAGGVQESIVALGEEAAAPAATSKPVPSRKTQAPARNLIVVHDSVPLPASERPRHPALTAPARFTRWLFGYRRTG
jgi:hypothetical protein